MIRFSRALVLSVLALCAPAASNAADEAGRLFDGADGSAAALPRPDFTTAHALAAGQAERIRGQEASGSAADLFYFTPEEAAAGRILFESSARAPRTRGYTFDRDVPADIQEQMRGDLAFIRSIRGRRATPLHQQIFGAVDGQVYDRFFEDRVTAIGMSGCGNANAVACVNPIWNSSKMWLTKNFVKFNHPQISRMMVVFHEARHTERGNGNWPHAKCPSPFRDANGNDMKSIWTGASLAGEPACDRTPFGSYGSSTIMLKNVAVFCENCTEKVRMDAALYADDQLGRITDPDAKKRMQDDLPR